MSNLPVSWIINVGGRAYGPYDEDRLRAFVAEGRLAPQSLIARSDETQFRAAGDEPELTALFQPPKLPGGAIAQALRLQEPEPSRIFGQENDANGERSHFVIIADMKSRSIDGLNDEIVKLGPAFSILPQTWVLSTEQSVNAVRNTLIQQLGKLDALFVIDATHDKAAWFNFGPEPDARIRRIWTKHSEAPVKLSRAV
jgi:hypothetical protein